MKPRKSLKRNTPMKRTGFKKKSLRELMGERINEQMKALNNSGATIFDLQRAMSSRMQEIRESVLNNKTQSPSKVRAKAIKKKTPLRKVSKKRSSEFRIYSQLRKAYLEQHPYCQFKDGLSLCFCQATEIHHKAGREKKWLNMVNFWVGLCSKHHDFIEKNRSWSYDNGFLIRDSIELREEGKNIK